MANGADAPLETPGQVLRSLVLCIDDDAAYCAMAAEMLGEHGYTVETVHTAEEALRRLRDVRPALILLDAWLPAMGGRHFLHVYGTQPGPPAPVLVVSAAAGAAELAAEPGVVGFLAKPHTVNDLVAAVRTHTGPAAS